MFRKGISRALKQKIRESCEFSGVLTAGEKGNSLNRLLRLRWKDPEVVGYKRFIATGKITATGPSIPETIGNEK